MVEHSPQILASAEEAATTLFVEPISSRVQFRRRTPVLVGPSLANLTVSSSSSHYLSLNREGRWGTTADFATSLLHFSLFSTAL